jgi:DNA repair exonuclease SbcCD ATPase subunit
MSNANDNTRAPLDASLDQGKSPTNSGSELELEHSQSNYESTLKGVALARYHLEQAQKRAYEASLAYQLELAKKIEAEKAKREAVLAELDRLRYDLAQQETELNKSETAIDELTDEAIQASELDPPLINPEDYSV